MTDDTTPLFPPPPADGALPVAAGPAGSPEPPEPPGSASRRPLGTYVAAGVVAAAAVGVGFAGVHLSDSLRGSDNGTAVQPVVGTDGSGGQVPGIEGSGSGSGGLGSDGAVSGQQGSGQGGSSEQQGLGQQGSGGHVPGQPGSGQQGRGPGHGGPAGLAPADSGGLTPGGSGGPVAQSRGS